ncbi:hypothetical protein GCM10027157_13690 [Corynebacterium aquatimens]
MRALAVVIIVLVIPLGIWVLGERAQKTPPIQGDQLGMEAGESFDDYTQRAKATHELLDDDTSFFALVTFRHPLDTARASEVLDHIKRVDAIVVDGVAPIPVGEPRERAQRALVFDIALRRIGGGGAVDKQLLGVVVHDSGAALTSLNDDQVVAAVEALPADAVWGNFGIRTGGEETAAGR